MFLPMVNKTNKLRAVLLLYTNSNNHRVCDLASDVTETTMLFNIGCHIQHVRMKRVKQPNSRFSASSSEEQKKTKSLTNLMVEELPSWQSSPAVVELLVSAALV